MVERLRKKFAQKLSAQEILRVAQEVYAQGEHLWHITVVSSDHGLCWVGMEQPETVHDSIAEWMRRQAPQGILEVDQEANREILKQLREYFQGARQDFTLPLDLRGTPFQRKVWEALGQIPFGQTKTYGEIAADIGCPKGPRAVGMANHNNALAIVIPCHRVIGKSGSLVGYASGLPNKERLLRLEQRINGL